jgi:hypothetical protein
MAIEKERQVTQVPPDQPQQPYDHPSQYSQQPQYAPQQYGPPPNAPGAVAALVCGIIGVAFGCVGIVLGPIAISQASKARQYLEAAPGQYGGDGLATAGRIMGIIATILGALQMLWVIGWFIFIALSEIQ